MIGTSAMGLVNGYESPGLGYTIMAPWTVARDQVLCACHHNVPTSFEKITFWLNLLPNVNSRVRRNICEVELINLL